MSFSRSWRVGVIADDLTSAADGAAPFLARGLRGALRLDAPRAAAVDAAVLAVDVDSRALPSGRAAAAATAAATRALRDRDILFKTVDSTLRGHLRAEIRAAAAAAGRSRLVFAPAFPAAGRYTVGGVQYVDGVAVSESVYGRDPVHPARRAALAELIDTALGRPLTVGLDASDAEVRALDRAADAPVLIIDADRQSLLQRRVAAIAEPRRTLWVGSPGLALALASRFAAPSPPRPRPLPGATRVLVLVGSLNPQSRAQAARLRAAGADADADAGVVTLIGPAEPQADPDAVVAALARDAAALIARRRIDAVIVTGGATARALLDALKVRQLQLENEFEPGFPLARATLPTRRETLLVAMKAGGFGGPEALQNAAARLLAAAPRPTARR